MCGLRDKGKFMNETQIEKFKWKDPREVSRAVMRAGIARFKESGG